MVAALKALLVSLPLSEHRSPIVNAWGAFARRDGRAPSARRTTHRVSSDCPRVQRRPRPEGDQLKADLGGGPPFLCVRQMRVGARLKHPSSVFPTKVGIQIQPERLMGFIWAPTFVGETEEEL
jgi:hypothetical protein